VERREVILEIGEEKEKTRRKTVERLVRGRGRGGGHGMRL